MTAVSPEANTDWCPGEPIYRPWIWVAELSSEGQSIIESSTTLLSKCECEWHARLERGALAWVLRNEGEFAACSACSNNQYESSWYDVLCRQDNKRMLHEKSGTWSYLWVLNPVPFTLKNNELATVQHRSRADSAIKNDPSRAGLDIRTQTLW
jgi:hypothetical protein